MFTSNCDIDPSSIEEFSQALDRYARFRHDKHDRSYEYALNRSAKDVAAWAAHYTIRADKGKLRALLADPAVAAKILAARFTAAGKKRPSGAVWLKMVAYFRAHTPSTAAFMASGWLPAFRTLRAYAKESSGLSAAASFGRSNEVIPTKFSYGPLGEAIPAREVGANALAVEITNMSVNPRNPTSGDALIRFGETALDKALQKKGADMMEYLDRVGATRADEFNGRG